MSYLDERTLESALNICFFYESNLIRVNGLSFLTDLGRQDELKEKYQKLAEHLAARPPHSTPRR
jgi:hypothetical protein